MDDETFTCYGGQRGGGRIFHLEQMLSAKQAQLKETEKDRDRWQSAALYYRDLYKKQKQGENTMDLKDTIEMMNSSDYKERFKAEYLQTKIRYEKLHNMCVKYEAGTLDFTPTCSLGLLRSQKCAMGNYLHCLEVRAQIEGIEL